MKQEIVKEQNVNPTVYKPTILIPLVVGDFGGRLVKILCIAEILPTNILPAKVA